MPCIAQVPQLPQLSSKKKKSCHWDIVQDRMNWCWRWICDRQSGGNQESPIELQNNICWVSLWSWPHQKGISNGGIKDKSSVGWDRGTAIGIDGGGIWLNSRGQVEPLLVIAKVWNTIIPPLYFSRQTQTIRCHPNFIERAGWLLQSWNHFHFSFLYINIVSCFLKH